MKTILARLLFAAILLLGCTANVRAADDLAAVKAAMAQRLPKLDALKAAGALGENNAGLLEVRDAKAAGVATLAAEENKDRTTVYAALAKQTGTSADQVARARAKKIAEISPKGVWVQDDKGAWAKK